MSLIVIVKTVELSTGRELQPFEIDHDDRIKLSKHQYWAVRNYHGVTMTPKEAPKVDLSRLTKRYTVAAR